MVTLGTDPEFLVYDRHDHGEVWLPYDVAGTKEEPHDLGEGYAVHRDGATAELTVPASSEPQEAAEILGEGIDRLGRYLNDLGLGVVDWASEYNFEHMEEFAYDPYDDAFFEFGCSPDKDAYTGGNERLLKDPRAEFRFWRFAGGHIHIGADWNVPNFVAAMFMDLALCRLATYSGGGTAGHRRRWYGKAGCYRDKPYGMEYRTPNNQWTFGSRSRVATYNQVHDCASWLENTTSDEIKRVWETVPWLRLQTVINEGSQVANKEWLNKILTDAINVGFLEA